MATPNGWEIVQALRARLELDADLGIEHIDYRWVPPVLREDSVTARPPAVAQPTPNIRHHNPSSAPVDTPARPVAGFTPAAASRPLPDDYISLVPYVAPPENAAKERELAQLRNECLSCSSCALCERRSHVAWGEGSLDAPVMFIGEGPGRDEDREGRPFVGRSGRLLTDIIEKGMKMPRSHVYIANVVKCRPPGNRDPRPEEITACSRYLQRQIEVIGPKIIVAVGGVAGCALLGLPPRSPGLRRKWHEYHGLPMRVIFHPSYLLRQRRFEEDRTAADREVWNDILEVMAKLGTL